jgi:hypothetical protein
MAGSFSCAVRDRQRFLDNFRASLAQLGLGPEGGLADLGMTALASLAVVGVEPSSFPALPYLPEGMATLTVAEVAQQGLHVGWGHLHVAEDQRLGPAPGTVLMPPATSAQDNPSSSNMSLFTDGHRHLVAPLRSVDRAHSAGAF